MSSNNSSSSSSSKPPGDGGGAQRAAEMNDAMLNIPGYADDSMLFIVRYGTLAKNTLRKVDFDEFMARVQAMNEYWFKSGGGGSGSNNDAGSTDNNNWQGPSGGNGGSGNEIDPADPRSVKAAELKARTLDQIKDFPELVRGFDKFVSCTRLAGARYKK